MTRISERQAFLIGFLLALYIRSYLPIMNISKLNELFIISSQFASRPTPPPLAANSSISMYDQNFTFHSAQSISIIFMGDSFSRFQYLSLANYLRTNGTQWIDSKLHKENPIIKRSFRTMTELYLKTNSLLSPYETCDCLELGHYHENRFYWDPVQHNNIAFIKKLGSQNAMWSWNASQVHDRTHANNGVILNRTNVKYSGASDWKGTITDYICTLRPKYKVIVLNAGKWPHDLNNETVQDDIVEAIRSCGMISVYKTTEKKQSENDTMTAEYEQSMCNKTDLCLNTSWTGKLAPYYYVDRQHFREPIYRMINTQLLEMLENAGAFMD